MESETKKISESKQENLERIRKTRKGTNGDHKKNAQNSEIWARNPESWLKFGIFVQTTLWASQNLENSSGKLGK